MSRPRRGASGRLISIASIIRSESFDREALMDHAEVHGIGQIMKFVFQPVNHTHDFGAVGGTSDCFAGLLTAPANGSVVAVSFRPRRMSMTCFPTLQEKR